MMFEQCLSALGTEGLGKILKSEIENLDGRELPLQQGMSRGNVALESNFSVMILHTREEASRIHVKSGVFFQSINAGSCCVNDPTPVEPHDEYCEMEFEIDKKTGVAVVCLADY